MTLGSVGAEQQRHFEGGHGHQDKAESGRGIWHLSIRSIPGRMGFMRRMISRAHLAKRGSKSSRSRHSLVEIDP